MSGMNEHNILEYVDGLSFRDIPKIFVGCSGNSILEYSHRTQRHILGISLFDLKRFRTLEIKMISLIPAIFCTIWASDQNHRLRISNDREDKSPSSAHTGHSHESFPCVISITTGESCTGALN